MRLQQPRAYQMEGEQQREIPIRYRVHGQKVSFALGKYNRHQKLVIDPVLTYSTYLGGSGGDTAYGVAVDASGDAYVTGVTASTNFPTTSGHISRRTRAMATFLSPNSTPPAPGSCFRLSWAARGTTLPPRSFLTSVGRHLHRGEHDLEQLPHHLRRCFSRFMPAIRTLS